MLPRIKYPRKEISSSTKIFLRKRYKYNTHNKYSKKEKERERKKRNMIKQRVYLEWTLRHANNWDVIIRAWVVWEFARVVKAWNRFLVGEKKEKEKEKKRGRNVTFVRFYLGKVARMMVYSRRLEGRVVGSYLVGSAALSTSLSEGWV